MPHIFFQTLSCIGIINSKFNIFSINIIYFQLFPGMMIAFRLTCLLGLWKLGIKIKLHRQQFKLNIKIEIKHSVSVKTYSSANWNIALVYVSLKTLVYMKYRTDFKKAVSKFYTQPISHVWIHSKSAWNVVLKFI